MTTMLTSHIRRHSEFLSVSNIYFIRRRCPWGTRPRLYQRKVALSRKEALRPHPTILHRRIPILPVPPSGSHHSAIWKAAPDSLPHSAVQSMRAPPEIYRPWRRRRRLRRQLRRCLRRCLRRWPRRLRNSSRRHSSSRLLLQVGISENQGTINQEY